MIAPGPVRPGYGEVIVGEFSEPGPYVGGPQQVTTLMGDRLSPISAWPGPDAMIPSAPPSHYVPSVSEAAFFEIDSIGGGVQ